MGGQHLSRSLSIKIWRGFLKRSLQDLSISWLTKGSLLPRPLGKIGAAGPLRLSSSLRRVRWSRPEDGVAGCVVRVTAVATMRTCIGCACPSGPSYQCDPARNEMADQTRCDSGTSRREDATGNENDQMIAE